MKRMLKRNKIFALPSNTVPNHGHGTNHFNIFRLQEGNDFHESSNIRGPALVPGHTSHYASSLDTGTTTKISRSVK